MSSQGTGAIVQHSLERQLLLSWGEWARNGGADMGYTGMPWLRKRIGGTPLFSDDLMFVVDTTIATLPRFHKRTLKKVYLSRRGILIPQTQKDSALMAFAAAWSDAELSVLDC